MQRFMGASKHTMLGPGGKIVEPLSESALLDRAINLLQESYGKPKSTEDEMIEEAVSLLDRLRKQVRAGYHRNPMLVTYNPPRSPIITDDVQAILYRHAEDGKDYVHAFGGVEPSIKHRGSAVMLDGLAETTGVQALVRDGGRTITLRHTTGAMLAKEF